MFDLKTPNHPEPHKPRSRYSAVY